MKRSSKTRNKPAKSNKKSTVKPVDDNKRTLLRRARNGAIGIFAVGGIGLALTQYVRSEIHEHDLTRIDNGKPTVVQIHDPQCSQCKSLQKKARAALKQFDSEKLDYVVANIRTPEGRQFANQNQVQHVTLLLFDRRGKRVAALHGQRSSEALAAEFRKLK